MHFGGPMGDEALSAPAIRVISAPHGFAVRYSPADITGHWHDLIALDGQRMGVLIGCCTDARGAGPLRELARAALIRSGDPVVSLDSLGDAPVSALCAVIDGETLSCSTRGLACAAVAAPGGATVMLGQAEGRLAVAAVDPGATVLLATGPIPEGVGLPDGCAVLHPERVADRVVVGLTGSGVVVLYRHPPEPLAITLPATPDSLSISRGRLRDWLASAAVDPEACADLLLAVGEATANATEHAVLGASGDVQITLTAAINGLRIAATVADNGVWKPVADSPGHRGHGIPLINALVDSADLSTTSDGTTVTMLKDLQP
ncbi:MAG: ATP-binding protein [Mycobacterium sp.]